MSESLRNDGRIWLPLHLGDNRPPAAIPEAERDYFLERQYPSYGNLVPRDLASRRARELCLEGRGVGPGGRSVYLDLAGAITRGHRQAEPAAQGLGLCCGYGQGQAMPPDPGPLVRAP
jgi:succinate dehydrogenase / fumarate reductase flavoprotein subunit